MRTQRPAEKNLIKKEFISLILTQTKRPPGNWAVSSFQGRIVPTEVRINHQNFLAKSYGSRKGSVKEFLHNKCFCFQQLIQFINIPSKVTKNVIRGL